MKNRSIVKRYDKSLDEQIKAIRERLEKQLGVEVTERQASKYLAKISSEFFISNNMFPNLGKINKKSKRRKSEFEFKI